MCLLVNQEKSDWNPKNIFSWISFTINACRSLIYATAARIESLCCDVNELCADFEVSASIHVKRLASIVGKIISLSACCGNATQIMTRYLHLIVNSRVRGIPIVFIQDQAKKELLFGETIWAGDLHDVYATPSGARLLIGRNWGFGVPTGGFDDVLYAPPSGAGLLISPNGGNTNTHPPGGVGLMIRPQVMFLLPPGSVHDVLYAPRGLHICYRHPRWCRSDDVLYCPFTLICHFSFCFSFSFVFVRCFHQWILERLECCWRWIPEGVGVKTRGDCSCLPCYRNDGCL